MSSRKYHQCAVILGRDSQTRQNLGEHDRGWVIVGRNSGIQQDIWGGIAGDPDDAALKCGDNHFGREHRDAPMLLAHPENRRFAQFPRSALVRKRIVGTEPPALAQFLCDSLGNVLAEFDGAIQGDVGGLEPDGRGFRLATVENARHFALRCRYGRTFALSRIAIHAALALRDRNVRRVERHEQRCNGH